MTVADKRYLGAVECLLAVRQRIDELSKGIDPAPWHVAGPASQPGDNQTPNLRKMAIYKRADLTFFRAMLLGSLEACFLDDEERWRIPGWAWADQGGDWRSLVIGNDFLHPLAPPDVRRWARCDVMIQKAEFERWLASDELEDQSGFPALPVAYDESERPAYVTYQEPPERPNVSLSHAVSWIAFSISLDALTLMSALDSGLLGLGRIDAHRRLEKAIDTLTTAGTGDVTFFGKFHSSRDEHMPVLTTQIDPALLEDFRQFDETTDGLRYGEGLLYDRRDPNVLVLNTSRTNASQRFDDVKVDRCGLMSLKPTTQTLQSRELNTYDAPEDCLATQRIRTGDPGRPPKGYNFYLAEHNRRCEAGEAMTKVAHEAEYLAEWYASQYPDADPVSSGTVENRIRQRHQKYRLSDPTKIS